MIPQASGTISKVCVKEGQRVSAGQSLFIIDQVPFLAAVQMAEANVEAAKAGVDDFRRRFMINYPSPPEASPTPI